MAKIEDIKRVAKFLKESVKQLEREGSSGCYNIVCPGVYGDLRVVVGWTGGYDEGDYELIHSKAEPEYVICAAIKVNNNNYMESDLDLDFNYLYFEESGDCFDTSVAIGIHEDYELTAKWLLEEAEKLDKWQFEETGEEAGKILGHRAFFELSEEVGNCMYESEIGELRRKVKTALNDKLIDNDEAEKLADDIENQKKTFEDEEDETDE